MGALGDSADGATYWQEPEAEDSLCHAAVRVREVVRSHAPWGEGSALSAHLNCRALCHAEHEAIIPLVTPPSSVTGAERCTVTSLYAP
ncbi:hypothetical protein GCM10009548_91450 [Streptomyces malaysiensis subsp. malaysiensis]